MGDRGEAFGLFVSCVEGQPVTRFGSKVLIGADRDPANRRKVRYNPKQIVALPHEEATRYAREYARAIEDGSLTQHTADEWLEQQRRIEGGAPREKLKPGARPPDAAEGEPPNADHEGGRQ